MVDGLRLEGVSGMAVNVSGRAFRVNGPVETLAPGSILLLSDSREADITPYLSSIVGIICDNGSAFDHIGILAREMGVAAIYNTKTACRDIKPGSKGKFSVRLPIMGKPVRQGMGTPHIDPHAVR